MSVGCNGLEELLGIEPAFEEFLDTLFSNASMNLERSVQSKEVNKKLDRDIDLFLTRLSPYLLLKPSLKCIEWLLHRYFIMFHLTWFGLRNASVLFVLHERLMCHCDILFK